MTSKSVKKSYALGTKNEDLYLTSVSTEACPPQRMYDLSCEYELHSVLHYTSPRNAVSFMES